MYYLIAAGLLSAVTVTVLKTNSRRPSRATVTEDPDEPVLFI